MSLDLEDRLRATLQTKAAQLEPCNEPLVVSAKRQRRGSALWLAAAAAAVVVAVASAVVMIERDATVTTDEPNLVPTPSAPTTVPTTPSGTDPLDQIVGLAPTNGVPEGWIVTDADFAAVPDWNLATRQLFGDADAPQPMHRSVLIMSMAVPFGPMSNENAATPAPTPGTPVVRGADASIVPNADGSFAVQWSSGDVQHEATIRGMNEADGLAFIDSLQARRDPAAGFDAAPGTLVEIPSETAAAAGRTFFMTLRPAGSTPDTDGPHVFLHATLGSDTREFRAGATAEPDGTLVIRQDSSNGRPWVRALRPDGWQVTVETSGVEDVADAVARVETIRAGLRLVTGRELIDAGRALPVMEEVDVDGQHIRVHGVDGFERAICLGPADSARCGLAASVPGAIGAWILTDQGWVVAVRGGRVANEVWDSASAMAASSDAPPPGATDVPSDEWAVVDVRDHAWWVTLASSEGGATVSRPLP